MTTIHVSKNDPSAFSTLQEAILSIDDRHDETIRIEVAPGIYEEKLFIRKENIEIVGDDPLMTVFRYGDGAKKPRPDGSGEYGTFNTAVIFIAGKDITLRNLTIESTAGPGYLAGQALAVYAAADRLSCYNCRFTGWQDTIFNGDPMTCNMKKLMLPDFFQPVAQPAMPSFFHPIWLLISPVSSRKVICTGLWSELSKPVSMTFDCSTVTLAETRKPSTVRTYCPS